MNYSKGSMGLILLIMSIITACLSQGFYDLCISGLLFIGTCCLILLDYADKLMS